MNSIVVCDTETTGVDAQRHRVIEVALARVDDGNWDDFKIETFRIDIPRVEYERGEPRAYEVNGYRPGHPDWHGAPLCDTPAAQEVYAKIAARLHKAALVNQNASFDARFLWEELCRHNVQRVGGSTPYSTDADIKGAPWEGNTWDVQAFSRALMKAAGRKGWKLHTVYEEVCGGPALPRHRAEADVMRALWVLARGKERHPEIWPDFRLPTEAICEAVTRWSRERAGGAA